MGPFMCCILNLMGIANSNAPQAWSHFVCYQAKFGNHAKFKFLTANIISSNSFSVRWTPVHLGHAQRLGPLMCHCDKSIEYRFKIRG